LVGIAILPVIKFSVEWNSLHQPASVMRLGAPTIHPSLLWPLLVMALGFMALFAALYLKAMRNEILRRRLKSLRKVAATGAGAALSQQAAGGRPGFGPACRLHLVGIRRRGGDLGGLDRLARLGWPPAAALAGGDRSAWHPSALGADRSLRRVIGMGQQRAQPAEVRAPGRRLLIWP